MLIFKRIKLKYVIVILLLLFGHIVHSQNFINRAGAANTVIDQRLGAAQNFFLPRLSDTTLSGGFDSIGNLIYDRLRSKIAIRDTVLTGGHKFTFLFKQDDTATVLATQYDLTQITSGINQLTGDVTAGPGSGSQVATISNNAVAYSKLQQIAANSLVGNPTGSTANATNILKGYGLIFTGGTLLADTSALATQFDLIQAIPSLTATQVAFGSETNVITSEAAFNYTATTNKLTVDSIVSIKLQADTVKLNKSPQFSTESDTLLTRNSSGNIGKVWNIGVSHLDDGANATRNTAWFGNGKWEVNGVHTFFKVDESNFPADGDSVYTNSSLAGYQHYNIYREGILQYMDTIDGVEIDTATGTITWHPPLVSNERVSIKADKLSPLRGQPFVQFDINSVPNVRAWFDATDATTITQVTGVSQWNDKTPNANNLTQGTGSNQPAYFSSGGSGNQAYVRFNSSDFMQKTFSVADSAAITVYLVMKQLTYTSQGPIYGFATISGTAGLYSTVNTDPSATYFGHGNYDGVGQNGGNLNTGWGEWQLVKAVFRGANNNYVTKNKEGSMQYGNSPEGIGAGSPTTLKNEFIQFRYWNDSWDLSEAVIIKGESTAINDNSIKSYLMSKYQIPNKKLIVMFGDSHTAGLLSGTPSGRAYYLITSKDKGYDVMNMGINSTVAFPLGGFGGQSGKNLSNLYNQFDQYITDNPDTYVIFQYGTNDGTSPTNAAWVTSYKASIQHFIDLGVPTSKIIICSPPYNSNPTYATNLANAVPVISGIATDKGIQFCDFYTYMQSQGLDCNTVSGGDGIHGNGTIHTALATLLKTFLQ